VPTATPTATATSCNAASVQATYTFNSADELDCWQAATGSAPYVTSFGVAGDNPHTGGGSLHIVVNNTSGSAQNIQAQLNYSPVQDLTGATLTAWIYVDSSLATSTWSTGLQPFDQYGPDWGSATFEAPNWFNVVSAPNTEHVDSWFPVTIVIANGGDPSQILQIGMQLTGVPAGAMGNFYIDDVQITYAAIPTVTPTPTETTIPGTPVCTVTPVNPTYYSEQEPAGSGGSATGTNDSCATGENPGAVSAGSDVVITGSLSSTGGGSWDLTQDQDFYLFTAGTAGNYTFALDCYSTGTDNKLVDIFIWSADGSCSYIYDSGPASPYNEVSTTSPLAPGDSVYIAIFAYDGTGPIPYRLTLIPPSAVDTPTPTETTVPGGTDTPTETLSETPTETTIPAETATPTKYNPI
jgi:hypothetical protein